jgi:Glycosyltransferase like family
MIAFATSIREADAYREHAAPGIALAAEPDSEVYAFKAAGAVCGDYNIVLDRAAQRDDLEALVLVDEDTEIVDGEFCAKVRRALADPEVGLVGCTGATGVESVAWWEGAVNSGHVVHRYAEHGGGDLDAFAWARTGAPPAEVDTVAGFLLVLSQSVARSLRFDEALRLGVGFDLDFALRVRESGTKVVTADLHVVHHRALELVDDLDVWVEGHIDLADKWDGRLPGAPPRPADWKQRARLAEAERDAARAESYSNYSRREAQLVPLQHELEAMTTTFGWRLTSPLRRLNALRRRAGRPPAPAGPLRER